MMERAEFHEHIGDENLLPSLEAALARAREILAAAAQVATDQRPHQHA